MSACHSRRLQCFCEGNGASVPHSVEGEIQFREGGVGHVISTKQRSSEHQPTPQTAAGSDVAHVCATKVLHNGMRVRQLSHTTSSVSCDAKSSRVVSHQALWFHAWACHANAFDAKCPGSPWALRRHHLSSLGGRGLTTSALIGVRDQHTHTHT